MAINNSRRLKGYTKQNMQQNIKICFCIGAISRTGGTERVCSIIANELAEKGFDISVLSFWNHGTPHFHLSNKVHVRYLLDPKKEGKLFRTFIYPVHKLRKEIRRQKYDILVDVDTVLSRFSGYAIRFTQCKLISWEHFNFWAMSIMGKKKRYFAKKVIMKHASKLVVLTEEDREKHLQEYRCSSDFVVKICNPCLSNVKNTYRFENNTFLFVGRLNYQKNIADLIRAWALVEKTLPNWKLCIVGAGELDRDLKKQAEELCLTQVEFVGQADSVDSYYRSASCLILSSKFEGFPMVILEAQSYGLPVISYDCKTGPRELIEDGVNGYLVEMDDYMALARKMIEFANNKEIANKMSEEAKSIISQYDLETITSAWCRLINEVKAS